MKNIIFTPLALAILAFSIGCHGQNQSNLTPAGKLENAGMLRHARAAHTATLLNNGQVLIVGGFAGGEVGISETEIFDSEKATISAGPRLSVGRSSHTATRLKDGRILIAGGFNGDYLDSAEIFDPKTERFLPIGKLTMPRSEHVAVLLANGEVLLAGGVGTNWTFLADAEIFSPVTNSFRETGAMTIARESHTATLLKDGSVLITGGHRGRRAAIEIFRSAEVYNPVKSEFSLVSELTVKRHKHDAVLLPDGRVLISGGSDERDSRGAYTSVEIFDPQKKIFIRTADLKMARYKHQGTSLLLRNGKVLIAGGATQPELFDPATGKFGLATGEFDGRRHFSTATALPDGRVFIAGGYGDGIVMSQKSFVFSF